MRRSVIGTEAVTAIVRVIGDTDIIAPITDPTMATTVIADPTTVMAMAIGPTGVQVSACGSASRRRTGHLNRRLIKTSGAAVRFSLSLRAATMSFGTPHKQRMLRAVSTRSALEDRRMNLLRSMCCLFGSRCVAPEEAKSAGDTMRAEQSVPADLGQKEADLEKTGKEQMSHMEGGGATGRKTRKPR